MDKKQLQGLFKPDRSDETVRENARMLSGYITMTRIGLEIVRQSAQGSIDLIRINKYNLQDLVYRLKLLVQFAKNNSSVYNKDIIDESVDRSNVKSEMDIISLLQGSTIIDVLGITASLHPDDIDEFCDEIRAVKDRLAQKRQNEEYV